MDVFFSPSKNHEDIQCNWFGRLGCVGGFNIWEDCVADQMIRSSLSVAPESSLRVTTLKLFSDWTPKHCSAREKAFDMIV